jgi:hypothetical protein
MRDEKIFFKDHNHFERLTIRRDETCWARNTAQTRGARVSDLLFSTAVENPRWELPS